MTSDRQRVDYATAGIAGREVLARSCTADPPLRPLEWRTLAAVVSFTALYSRSSDALSARRLAAFVYHGSETAVDGLPKWQINKVRTALQQLHGRGLIDWSGVAGRPGQDGVPKSRIKLSPPDPNPPSPQRGLTPPHLRGDNGRKFPPGPRGNPPSPQRGLIPPRLRGIPEKLSEKPHPEQLVAAAVDILARRELAAQQDAGVHVRKPDNLLAAIRRRLTEEHPDLALHAAEAADADDLLARYEHARTAEQRRTQLATLARNRAATPACTDDDLIDELTGETADDLDLALEVFHEQRKKLKPLDDAAGAVGRGQEAVDAS